MVESLEDVGWHEHPHEVPEVDLMDHWVAGRIGQAQFQDVPIVLVDELAEDLFGLFVETVSC